MVSAVASSGSAGDVGGSESEIERQTFFTPGSRAMAPTCEASARTEIPFQSVSKTYRSCILMPAWAAAARKAAFSDLSAEALVPSAVGEFESSTSQVCAFSASATWTDCAWAVAAKKTPLRAIPRDRRGNAIM